jgi:hypothetical protein
MPSSTEKTPHPERRSDLQHPARGHGGLRDVENQVSDFDRDYEAPFDRNEEPIEDANAREEINRDGSER